MEEVGICPNFHKVSNYTCTYMCIYIYIHVVFVYKYENAINVSTGFSGCFN